MLANCKRRYHPGYYEFFQSPNGKTNAYQSGKHCAIAKESSSLTSIGLQANQPNQ
jgi:hypothetical protein